MPSRLEERAADRRFLDRETAKIDALIAEQEAPDRAAEGEAPGGHLACGHEGAGPDVPMKDSGVEWLGEVPAHWEAKRLLNSRFMPLLHTEHKTVPFYEDGEYLVVYRTTNIKTREAGSGWSQIY